MKLDCHYDVLAELALVFEKAEAADHEFHAGQVCSLVMKETIKRITRGVERVEF